MRRLGLVVSSLACAAVLLNCGEDEVATTPNADSGTDGPTGQPDTGGGGTDAGGTDSATQDTGVDAGPPPLTLYAVDDTNQLVSFKSNAPGAITKKTITGVDGLSVHGIDFRPANGALYALVSGQTVPTDAKIYTIDKATAAATVVPTSGDTMGAVTFPWTLDGTSFGFDFNPAADRIRVHSNTGLNRRLHPANGESVNVAGDGTLTYADGGNTAPIVATAYINSVSAKPATTTVYGIDPASDQVTVFANDPNGVTGGFAVATVVGALGVDAEDVAGFDIYGGKGGEVDGGAPTVTKDVKAFAALRVGGTLGLYTIDLSTGKATLVGAIGHDKPLRGLTVEP